MTMTQKFKEDQHSKNGQKKHNQERSPFKSRKVCCLYGCCNDAYP